MGVLIVDRDGLIVHATMPPQEAAQLTGPALQLLQRARSACDEDDELEMLCVRTRKYEMLLCSEMKGAFAVCPSCRTRRRRWRWRRTRWERRAP